jgi:hypothetical protein
MKATITQLESIGAKIANILNLKKDPEHSDRWLTNIGTKTNIGLALTVINSIESEVKPIIDTNQMCSICAGTMETLDHKPCICKNGTIDGECAGLRGIIFDMGVALDVMRLDARKYSSITLTSIDTILKKHNVAREPLKQN